MFSATYWNYLIADTCRLFYMFYADIPPQNTHTHTHTFSNKKQQQDAVVIILNSIYTLKLMNLQV